jgi:Zinc carboxypeptidase
VQRPRPAAGRAPLRPPEEAFGFRMGADRRLARWGPIRDYLRELAAASDRLLYQEYGRDWNDQPLALLTISDPSTIARLDHFRAIQAKLADPRLVRGGEGAALLESGRTVCLVTCSIHATEVGPTQLMPEFVHDLVARDDDDVRRWLREVILLVIPCLNPGGLELVADWYERTLDTPYEGTAPPEPYHPYAGHDNNRDWFMLTQTENRATVERVLNAWNPHVVLDLHQMPPNGPRFVVPPYLDPYDPNVDAVLQAEIDALGTSIAAELAARGCRGVAHSVIFDAFSPSRAYPHYHGGARILAEAAGCRLATPIDVPGNLLAEARGFDPRVASHVHPLPWPGGTWRLRDILDVFKIAILSVLDHASRYRDRWVENFLAIQERATGASSPFAFVIMPLDQQRDPGTSTELVEVLIRGGVEVDCAARSFLADGVEFPAGAYVVPIGQPAGRYAKTLLEIQQYPSQQINPGGPPIAPYDITSHTLPLQMGVDTIRISTPFVVSTTRLAVAPAPPSGIESGPTDRRFVISPEANASVRLVNRLLVSGVSVGRCRRSLSVVDRRFPPGAFVVDGADPDRIRDAAREVGTRVYGTGDVAGDDIRRLAAPRIGLYRSWRPTAIDGGWTRFVLEQFEFRFQCVRDADLKRGDLAQRFDVIVLPQQPARDILEGNSAAEYPPEYAGGIGDAGVANLRRFVEGGGTLVALDSACDLVIGQLYLPVSNVLDGIRPDLFSAPGSLLRILVDADHPIGWGFEREAAAMFVSSPAFEARGPVEIVAEYPLTNQLLSGWLHGAELIAGRAAIVDVPVGRGRATLIGFRPQFRAQARGTYRILFNAILAAGLADRDRPWSEFE